MYSGEMSTLSVAFGRTPVRAIDCPTAVGTIWTIQERLFHSAPAPRPMKTVLRELSATFPGDEHVRAGSPFGVGEYAVFLDDEGATERHHHQHAEDAPGKREERDLEVVEERLTAFAEEDQRRDGEDDAGGHRLARGADRLHDVVLENRGSAQTLEHGDREHGDRNRGTDGQIRHAGRDRRSTRRRSGRRRRPGGWLWL